MFASTCRICFGRILAPVHPRLPDGESRWRVQTFIHGGGTYRIARPVDWFDADDVDTRAKTGAVRAGLRVRPVCRRGCHSSRNAVRAANLEDRPPVSFNQRMTRLERRATLRYQ